MAYYSQAQREQAMYADATRGAFSASQQLPQHFYPDPRAQVPLNHPSHGYLHAQQQAQYGGYSGEAMAMPPPSTTGAPMTGGTMQLGISQRPSSAQYQAHMQNNQPNPSAYIPPPNNFANPQTAQSFYPHSSQPTPSPTHNPAPSSSTTIPAKAAMASAPPQNRSPQHAQQQAQQQRQQQSQAQHRPQSSSSSQKQILQPPLSPKSQRAETQRVTALLEINRVLLYEMTQLQAAGRFGPLFGQPRQPDQSSLGGADGEGGTKRDTGEVKDGAANANGDKATGPVQSREYIECMRRLQSNLAYLAYAADRAYKPADQIPRFPAIMDPPTSVPGNMISEDSMTELKQMYAAMKELFPEYAKSLKGKEEKMGAVNAGAGSGAGGVPAGSGGSSAGGPSTQTQQAAAVAVATSA